MDFTEISQIIQQNSIIFSIFFFFLGSCFASFFNVYSLRYNSISEQENANDVTSWFESLNIPIPAKITELASKTFNLSFPSSHCYSCKTPLKWYHNIPIISYLLLKGKCGFCHVHISKQYPIVEFFGGLIMLVVFHSFFLTTHNLAIFGLASFFFMATYLLLLIDWKTMFLPDEINYFLMWVGLLLVTFKIQFMPIQLIEAIHAMIASYMFFWILGTIGKKIKGVDVIGGGDLKLVAAMAPFIGMTGIFFTIFFSPIIGILGFIIGKTTKDQQFPYGPSLILSAWIYIFYGKEIMNFLGLL